MNNQKKDIENNAIMCYAYSQGKIAIFFYFISKFDG